MPLPAPLLRRFLTLRARGLLARFPGMRSRLPELQSLLKPGRAIKRISLTRQLGVLVQISQTEPLFQPAAALPTATAISNGKRLYQQPTLLKLRA